MYTYQIKDYTITLNNQGLMRYTKVSYPVRFGIYSELLTRDYIYQFNPNGDLKYIQAKDKNWPRDEWLKRTDGNDWIYYTPGLYVGLFSYIGEYYLPCFSYKSNSIFPYNPFEKGIVKMAINSINSLYSEIYELLNIDLPESIKNFLSIIIKNNSKTLDFKAKTFHNIIDGKITVLPPDSRHVDYEVIPVIIADGCIYDCDFCMIKDNKNFKTRKQNNITQQIQGLKEFYGKNLSNYNSLFLGKNDALYAGEELIKNTIEESYNAFDFKKSSIFGTNLFLFASIESFLDCDDSLFKYLNKSPYYTYINIGFESADIETLNFLGKPITVKEVNNAFSKMQEINRYYDRIEITANFVFSDNLPENHIPSIIELNKKLNTSFYEKGGIYLSPLDTTESTIVLKKKFIKIKNILQIPVFLYLIQRL